MIPGANGFALAVFLDSAPVSIPGVRNTVLEASEAGSSAAPLATGSTPKGKGKDVKALAGKGVHIAKKAVAKKAPAAAKKAPPS